MVDNQTITSIMEEQSTIKADFDAICSKYGLEENGEGDYYYLLSLFNGRRQGKAFSKYEILSDFSALEIAQMIRQLSNFKKKITSIGGGGDIEEYSSPQLIEILKKPLEQALKERVKKITDIGGKNYLILFIGYGAGGDEGRASMIPYPDGCTPQEEGFSKDELEILIKREEERRKGVLKMQGNKERWEDEGTSRLQDLGEQAEWIKYYIPQCWTIRKQHCFVFDFLFGAGFLDFKSKIWKKQHKDMKPEQKDRTIRNWIDSYRKHL